MSLNASNDPTSQSSARLDAVRSAPASPQSLSASAPQQSSPGASPRQGEPQRGAPAQASDQASGQASGQASEQDTRTGSDPAPQQPVAGYNDLPDGRPRYGVRVPAAEQAPEQPTGAAGPGVEDSAEQPEAPGSEAGAPPAEDSPRS
jgi:hypothetical protein